MADHEMYRNRNTSNYFNKISNPFTSLVNSNAPEAPIESETDSEDIPVTSLDSKKRPEKPTPLPFPLPEIGAEIDPEFGVDVGTGIPIFPTFPTPTLPSCPSCPTGPTIPTIPTIPDFPYPQFFGRVRFLNASTNTFPVSIAVDNTTYAENSSFGTITDYDWISDGFHTITIRRTTGLRTTLLQQTFPFTAGEKVTMVLVDSATGGLDLVQIFDTGCNNLPYDTGCYRVANMSFSGSSFDIMLYGGDTAFHNVSFQEATTYKQAAAGPYRFYVTNSSSVPILREIPSLVLGGNTSPIVNNPLLSYEAEIMSGQSQTTYLLGNTWSENALHAFTVLD